MKQQCDVISLEGISKSLMQSAMTLPNVPALTISEANKFTLIRRSFQAAGNQNFLKC